MKIYRLGILFVYVAISGAMAVARPEWLAGNEFLKGFVSYEIVAVLIVILTITFASVANIHLSLNRVSQRHKKHKGQVDAIRREINSDAWLIFWAFVVCVIALIIKGSAECNLYLIAVVHAVAMAVLLVNVLVLHTIYRAIFTLVTAAELLGDNGEEKQDFTEESPPAGSA